MPHAGLMNERVLGPVAGPLQRARLHLRGGRRRLRQGKFSAGIATLADALSAALEWHAARFADDSAGQAAWRGSPADERDLYRELVRSGRLTGGFDYDAFDGLVEAALTGEAAAFDTAPLLDRLDALMTELGVMPFDETALPPEDPGTF